MNSRHTAALFALGTAVLFLTVNKGSPLHIAAAAGAACGYVGFGLLAISRHQRVQRNIIAAATLQRDTAIGIQQSMAVATGVIIVALVVAAAAPRVRVVPLFSARMLAFHALFATLLFIE